jgi:hypothetical protein
MVNILTLQAHAGLKKMGCQKGRILSSDDRVMVREVPSRWIKHFTQGNHGQM